MKLRDVLDALAQDLNDNKPSGTMPTRWERSQLLRYFNEGLCHVYTVKPNEFAELQLVKLEPGSIQKVCGCKQLLRIFGQTDETGLVVRDIPSMDFTIATRWTKKGCPAPLGEDYRITGLAMEALDNGHFRVYPPVPPGEDVFINVLCANPPTPYTLADEDVELDDCQAVSAARQWVMFAALMVDDESEVGMAAAKIHAELFFSILDVQFSKNLLTQMQQSAKRQGGA